MFSPISVLLSPIKITSNPLLLGASVIILIIVLLSLVKKLFKLAGSLLVIGIVVFGVIYFTSDDPESTLQDVIEKGKQTVEEAKDIATEKAEELQKELDVLEEE